MGRSVATHRDAVAIAYLRPDLGTEEECWLDFLEDLRNVLTERFPSLREEDRWVGRETRSILENRHARIVVAEYCGMVSVSLVPKADSYGTLLALGVQWCASVRGSFHEHLAKRFPDSCMHKIGTASNGESFYRFNSPDKVGTVVERGEILPL